MRAAPGEPELDLAVTEHRLDNGLRVVLHRDTSLPLVAVDVWYHVGSKNERPGRTGFAHLFEHMLFQGSQNVGTNDHFRYVQQVGGVANGSTWYDRTNYYETLPSSHLELGLWLEADRMGFLLPAMTPEKLETQRQVVMNERRQRVDNQPYGRAFERLHELLYPEGHPYRWPVIGYMEDIAAATLEDVEAFFRTWYTPANSVLTLAGDFDPGQALELVGRYFGDLPSAPPPSPPRTPAAATTAAEEELTDDIELARVYLGFRVPGYGDRRWYAADLLATALAGGRSSPLYHDLVHERQIAQDVSVFALPTEMEATFGVVATVRPEATAAEVEARLRDHLGAVAAAGPAPADVERARNQTLSDRFEALQAVDQRADLLCQHAVYLGDPHGVGAETSTYRSLGADELRHVASHYLDPGQGVALRVVPAGGARPE